eukprot:364637-Chlamydomonas_euryale.AAC.9
MASTWLPLPPPSFESTPPVHLHPPSPFKAPTSSPRPSPWSSRRMTARQCTPRNAITTMCHAEPTGSRPSRTEEWAADSTP